jgi:hypothetical protein
MDRWLANLQKSPVPARPHAAQKEASVPLEFADLAAVDAGSVGGEGDFHKSLNEPQDPVGNFLEKTSAAPRELSPVSDERWDSPLTKTATAPDPATFQARSKARFEKVCAAFKGIFGDSEQYTEAVAIAKRAFDEKRADVLLAEIGAPLGKAEVTSRMFSMLTTIREDCTADEIVQLEKAARALDAAGFMEIAEGVIARARQAA